MLKRLAVAFLALCAACATPAPPRAPACAVSAADRAWIDASLDAWRFASREISEIASVPQFRAVFFDAACVLTSPDALTVNTSVSDVTWIATPHTGTITLPDGGEMPAGVTSFTSGENGLVYFVMSTPSVWQAGGVSGGAISLEKMMTAVLLHEASHVAQTGPYGPRLGRLIEQNNLADDFSDDSLQRHFQDNAEFAASVQRETELFMQAAAAPTDAEARRRAREARAMMRARAARWFTGADAYWAEAEDIWLTFEGAGQWTGYQWLVHPAGGDVAPEAVTARFVHGRWWSQTEGFALITALDRFANWKQHAYGDGAQTALEMLDQALAEE